MLHADPDIVLAAFSGSFVTLSVSNARRDPLETSVTYISSMLCGIYGSLPLCRYLELHYTDYFAGTGAHEITAALLASMAKYILPIITARLSKWKI